MAGTRRGPTRREVVGPLTLERLRELLDWLENQQRARATARKADIQNRLPAVFKSGTLTGEGDEMTFAELYRNWVDQGIEMGGVPVNGETLYKHRTELGLMAIAELEAALKRLLNAGGFHHVNQITDTDGERTYIDGEQVSFDRCLAQEEIKHLVDPSQVVLSGGAVVSGGRQRTWPAGGRNLVLDETEHKNHGVVSDEEEFRDVRGTRTPCKPGGRPKLFEIDRDNPLTEGMAGGPC
jgi:hypothetical protein